MHEIEDEYKHDDIVIDLSFENAEMDFEVDVNEGNESGTSNSTNLLSNDSLKQLENAITIHTDDNLLRSHLSQVAQYVASLEAKIQDLTVKNAMQTIDLHNMRQLYRSTLDENEELSTSRSTQEHPSPNIETPPTNEIKSQLKEYMELDMEVVKINQDKQKLSAENERITTMCAKFQEELIRRDIEVAESEKRAYLYSHQLNGIKQLHGEAMRENDELKNQVISLSQQNQTLQKHKKLLVAEVKTLQKFSHINVTGLEQDAHEARMMQKSISMQLEIAQNECDSLKEKLNALNIESNDDRINLPA